MHGPLLILLCSLLTLSACQSFDEGGPAAGSATPEMERYEFSRQMMGTEARIVLYHDDAQGARLAADAAFDRMSELNAVLSDYDPESEISKLEGGVPKVPVSDDLYRVLVEACALWALTDGAFDVTIGPLSHLWRAARSSGHLPSREEVEAARRYASSGLIHLEAGTVTLALRGMSLDFGGIGKGFAADEALAVLRQHGCSRALVEIGGDIALGDPPPHPEWLPTGWIIEIRFAEYGLEKQWHALATCGIATSGDAEQHMIIDGERYSHIIDPRTGYPLRNSRGVSVIAPDATTADALASAFSVLGEERSREIAARFDDVRVFFE